MLTTFLSNPLNIVVILLTIAVMVLIVMVVMMNNKLKSFLVGIDSKNIEDSLQATLSDLNELKVFRSGLDIYLQGVERRLKKSIQSVHTVRFNPFKGTGGGGNQSFSTAFINEDGDGVVISSLYSRDHVSVFGKPIKNHSSEHGLSEEEKESLDEAGKNLGA